MFFTHEKTFNTIRIGGAIRGFGQDKLEKAERIFKLLNQNQRLWLGPLNWGLGMLIALSIIQLINKMHLDATTYGLLNAVLVFALVALIADLIYFSRKRKRLIGFAIDLAKTEPSIFKDILSTMLGKDWYLDFTIRYVLSQIKQ
ncbi:MAG: hypothetical protein NT135_01290 [Candidatus Berkelbacteria bacterium]|nr:hypothetical protein [Candidatus Berkelbacteria bacterium]